MPRSDAARYIRGPLLATTPEDLEGLVAELCDEDREHFTQLLMPTYSDPRFRRGRSADLLRVRLCRERDPERLAHVVGILVQPVADMCFELLGERMEDPSVDDLREAFEGLVARYSDTVVQLYFGYHVVTGANARDALVTVLEEVTGTGRGDASVDTEDAHGEDEDDEVPAPENDELLFDPIDQLLIKTVVASLAGQVGAPDTEQLQLLVAELLKLNAERKKSWFHPGFLSALLPEYDPPLDDTMNAERWRWFQAGRLHGLVRKLDQEALWKELSAWRERCDEVLADGLLGPPIWGPVLTAALTRDVDRAAAILGVPHDPWRQRPHYRAVIEKARLLIGTNRVAQARTLLDALEPLTEGFAHLEFEVWRLRIGCLRVQRDFAGAERVWDQRGDVAVAPTLRARLLAERGLIAARIDQIATLEFPVDASETTDFRRRLAPAVEWLDQALGVDALEPRASTLLGLDRFCAEDWSRAAALLDQAVAGLADDDIYRQSGTVAALRFHAGLARLLAQEPGAADLGHRQIEQAFEDGHTPDPRHLVQAAEALAILGSPHAASLVDRATRQRGPVDDLVDLIAGNAQALGGEWITMAARLGQTRWVVPSLRFECLFGAIQGAVHDGDPEEAARLIDEMEVLLAAAGRDELDERWADLLYASETITTALGAVEAQVAATGAYLRLGRPEQARAILRSVFFRVRNAVAPPITPLAALDLLEALGATDTDLSDMRDLLGDAPEPVVEESGEPVRLAFVGGNEIQAQYCDDIDAELAETFAGRVSVQWILSGWSAGWRSHADRLDRLYPQLDAVVLMPFVRTNFGRWVRRTCGESGLVWVACSGHGRASIVRSLTEAVTVVDRIQASR